jgi:putative ABC transport system permease protein
VREFLESALGERYGFGVRPTLDVLAEFAGIENLYLLSFQLLGGIGLMLGACGLGVVLLRNVWERSGELALLQALGYPRRVLAILLLIENGTVTLMGVGIGLMAALLGLVPHLSSGVDVLAFVMRLAILMVTVLATGIVSGILAVRKALRLPILAILRRE